MFAARFGLLPCISRYGKNVRRLCQVSLPLPQNKEEDSLGRREILRQSLFDKTKFHELISQIKFPYKMQHHPEEAEQYLEYRLTNDPEGGPNELKMEDYESILEKVDDPLEKQKLRRALNDVIDYYNNVGRKMLFCPAKIPVADMARLLLEYDDFGSRLRYLKFLCIRDFDEWRKLKSKERRKEVKAKEEAADDFTNVGCFDEHGKLQYGFWRNTLATRYWEKALPLYSLHRLRQAAMFGQRLVIDCSYDEDMAHYETISVSRQLSAIYHRNRFSREPFHLMFTGYRETNRGYHNARKMLKDVIHNPAYFFNLHHESYQELLPNERLIYLSPDARQTMEEFDPQAVYIIGALVSKTLKSQKSWQKANEEGIEAVRLPIHKYVRLKPLVKKVLSFQGCFTILMEMKEHGDWKRAFQAGIISHKLMDEDRPEKFREA